MKAKTKKNNTGASAPVIAAPPSPDRAIADLISRVTMPERISKLDLQETAKEFSRAVNNAGVSNPLELLVSLRALAAFVEYVIEQHGPAILEELSKYGKDEQIKLRGVTIKRTHDRKTFDYSYDPRYATLVELSKAAGDKVKSREKFLQNIPEGEEVPDPETGVLLRRATYKGGGENYSVTIPGE